MTPIAITFLVISIVLVWGGLVVSVIALVRTSQKEKRAATAGAAPPSRT